MLCIPDKIQRTLNFNLSNIYSAYTQAYTTRELSYKVKMFVAIDDDGVVAVAADDDNNGHDHNNNYDSNDDCHDADDNSGCDDDDNDDEIDKTLTLCHQIQ